MAKMEKKPPKGTKRTPEKKRKPAKPGGKASPFNKGVTTNGRLSALKLKKAYKGKK